MNGAPEHLDLVWIERGAIAIEGLAVLLIVGFALVATVLWAYRSLTRPNVPGIYESYRTTLARSLLLGLELLVAADIVRTVALDTTVANILGLAMLVLIRTFLSWSLVVEIEGRWPWQPKAATDTES